MKIFICILIFIIICLFYLILSGSFCHCSPVKCPNTSPNPLKGYFA